MLITSWALYVCWFVGLFNLTACLGLLFVLLGFLFVVLSFATTGWVLTLMIGC